MGYRSIKARVDQYNQETRSLQRLVEETQAEAEAIKDGPKAQLAAQRADELQAGEYRVIGEISSDHFKRKTPETVAASGV